MRDKEEANEAIAAGTDVVMLGSIEGSELASVAQRERERWTGGKEVPARDERRHYPK